MMFNNQRNEALKFIPMAVSMLMILASCSSSRQIGKSARQHIFSDSTFAQAHVGISLYESGSKKYLYNYQADKFFVPASNTKLFTCYAAMKYLGDSLDAFQFIDLDTALLVIPTGDPTFLHQDYKRQPGAAFLKAARKPIYISAANWDDDAFGSGWSWNDYNEYYMAERSPFPVYGNVIRWVQEKTGEAPKDVTEFDQTVSIYSIPDVNWDVRFNPAANSRRFDVQRSKDENRFVITQGAEKRSELEIPYITNVLGSAIELMHDTISSNIQVLNGGELPAGTYGVIKSQPTDSLLKPLMHRSDNFFAEQVLLMVSNKLLGKMNDAAVTDTLLDTEFSFLPQRPRWADGSGLSRYNLFTPKIFISLLNRMSLEFGLDRVKAILPTGGTGTLRNFYKQDSGYIHAKTGTLSGVVALSGYLTTKKNKTIIFSVLVNNHRGNAVEIRRKVESFLSAIRERY